MTEVEFEALRETSLVVDAVYKGGTAGNAIDDPVSRILRVKSMGGIRIRGTLATPSLVALTSSGNDHDWPDTLSEETGVFTYFGDNKRPGRELHATPSRGNEVLRSIFDMASSPDLRALTPPTFIFVSTGVRRDCRFLGLAVPGGNGAGWSDELVGIWRSTQGLRYQNYRAFFTILDVPAVPRSWINSLVLGDAPCDVPAAWAEWIESGVARPLVAPRTREIRTRQEQEPMTEADRAALHSIWEHFIGRPHDFEHFAALLVSLYLKNATSIEVTRASKDGGRDAIGRYQIGHGSSGISIDFAVEAKCFQPGKGVGVKALSRLISRLRHRQFGVLITTSHLDYQAYSELKADAHPIIVISGRDIVAILKDAGAMSGDGVKAYLSRVAPTAGRT